jgi:hypothetical protein
VTSGDERGGVPGGRRGGKLAVPVGVRNPRTAVMMLTGALVAGAVPLNRRELFGKVGYSASNDAARGAPTFMRKYGSIRAYFDAAR